MQTTSKIDAAIDVEWILRNMDDAMRYRWLRKEMAQGRHADIAEGLTEENELDEYIDQKMVCEVS